MRWIALGIAVCFLLGCTPPRIELTPEETELVRQMRFPKGAEDARQALIALHPEWPEDIRKAVLAKEIPPPRRMTRVEMESLWRDSPPHPGRPGAISRIQAIAAWGPPSSRSAGFLVRPLTDIWTYNDVSPPILVWFVNDALDESPYYEEYPPPRDGSREPPRGKFGFQKSGDLDSAKIPTLAPTDP
ncbi:MAG: hypothetical protein U0573_15600 [Phycisphaerales bacterium]|nr:hypothetical protein [Planctomycetota bacterium]